MKTIKDLLDKHFEGLKIDSKLIKAIGKFKSSWIASNSEFLGSGLIGSTNLYFKTSDVNRLLSDILHVDMRRMRADYKYIEAIVPSRKVTSDSLNLCLMYLLYRINTSKLKDKEKEKGMFDVAALFNYRTLAALHSHRLPYLVKNEVAITAYENLSNRYKLKQTGSWIKYIEYRTNELLSKGEKGNKSPHINTLKTFKDDKAVLSLIGDTQGRVRSFMNLYMSELMRVKDTGEAMSSESGSVTIAGEVSTTDMKNTVSDAVSKVLDRLETVDDFVDVSLVNVITGIIPGSSPDLLIITLSHMSEKKNKKMRDFIEKSILFDYTYLMENGEIEEHKDDLPYLLMKIRGAYTSSRTTNPVVLQLRKEGMKIAKKSSGKINTQTLARIRTGVLIYLFVLSFIKR